MSFRNRLILQQFFLSALGIPSFAELSPALRSSLTNHPRVDEALFDCFRPNNPAPLSPAQAYSCAQKVAMYQQKLGRQRGEPHFRLKPYQLIAVFLSELFLDCLFNRPRELLAALEQFRTARPGPISDLPPFRESDLHKIAFWMATGSGKTLLMHINYWQILSHRNSWDNLLLITPNEGLSRQHFRELQLSGIPARLYDGNPDHLRTGDDELLVIDIYKLTPEKNGAGVSVDVRYFEGRNLVFIDEGHKGQRSVEQSWKSMREYLARDGMIWEYSATFGQVVSKNRFLQKEYAKAILFDYSYYHFYHDGYGKAFTAINLRRTRQQQDFHQPLLAAASWQFYRQMEMFTGHAEERRSYLIGKPLWTFVGSRVSGAKLDSDVLKVIRFLKRLLSDPKFLPEQLGEFCRAQPDIARSLGIPDISSTHFAERTEILYQHIFHGRGPLEIYLLRNAPGEMGLKCAGAEHYFGVINIGDVAAMVKLLREDDTPVQTDYFTRSLFDQLDSEETPVNILIGSKKFIEGWNSWRVSSMVLMNMGVGEGPQIIQLFGRGVRLKGAGFSLQREAAPPEWLALLQTLFIFGLNADYMNAFLKAIKTEGVAEETLKTLPVKTGALPFSTQVSPYRGNSRPAEIVELNYDPEIAARVEVDIRPPLSRVSSDEDALTKSPGKESAANKNIPLELIDYEQLWLDLLCYKQQNGWDNLLLNPEVIATFLNRRRYRVLAHVSQLQIETRADLEQLHQLSLRLCQTYLDRYYQQHTQ